MLRRRIFRPLSTSPRRVCSAVDDLRDDQPWRMGIFERESGMLQGGVAGNGRGRPRGFTDSANGSTETEEWMVSR